MHPLFERSRWPLDIDFDRLKPSCQFASAVVRCFESDKIFRTVFFGTSTMTDIVNGRGEKVPVIRGPRAYNTITDGERKQVQCRVRQLAPMININMSKGLARNTLGACARCLGIRRDCCPGPGSAIYMADSGYTGLDPAVTSKLSPAALKKRQIHFGSVLCHEAVHAACHATRNIGSFFSEDSCADEIGKEFEARMFGAVPNGHFNSPTVHWGQWPSSELVNCYTPARPVKGSESLPKLTYKWTMTDADAERLMDPVTWNHLYPTIGHMAIIPEMVEASIESRVKTVGQQIPVPGSIGDIYRSM